MVDTSSFNFDRVLEHIDENDHYKFKCYQKEGTPLKDIKDQQQWTVLHHYLHLSNPVDLNVVRTLVNDQGCDVKAEGAQKHTCSIVAAKNPHCTMDTLKALEDMGCVLTDQCETQANVMMYYTRYSEKMDQEVVKMLMAKGNDMKHADKNKMTILHYTMINMFAGADEMEFLVSNGADVDAKMAQDIDMLDLVIYTQNMKNANFNRILTLTRYLVSKMNIKDYDLRKCVVIQQLLTFDRLMMCQVYKHQAQLKGKCNVFQLPGGVFQYVTNYL